MSTCTSSPDQPGASSSTSNAGGRSDTVARPPSIRPSTTCSITQALAGGIIVIGHSRFKVATDIGPLSTANAM